MKKVSADALSSQKQKHSETRYDINIPSLGVIEAFDRLAEQTGSEFLFPYDIAETRTTQAVFGKYTVMGALKIMLRNSGLSSGLSRKGAIKIFLSDGSPNRNNKNGERKEMKNNISLFAGVTAFFVAVLAAPNVVGQGDNSASFMLEEITVTARKREESLQDTPISITAFTASDIEARQLSSIDQISESTPNLVFDPVSSLSGSSAASSVSIRGVGQLDFTLNTDPGVGMYVDGVYLTRSIGGLVNLIDIERIEVLRGPQGTLFGRNTIGGAINITSVKPHDTYEGSAELSIGRFDQLDGKLTFNAPLADNLYSRTSLSWRNRDGYIERLDDNQEMGNIKSKAGRVALRWLPSQDITVDFNADVTFNRGGSFPFTAINLDETAFFPSVHNTFNVPGGVCATPPSPTTNPQCYNNQFSPSDPYQTFAGLDSRSDLDIWGLSGTVSWDVGDQLTLKSITSYRDMKSNSNLDLDFSPLPIFDIEVLQEAEIFSQEVQALGTAFDNRLNWIVGLYYLHEEGNHIETIAASLFGIQSGGNTENESIAVFAQATYDVTDKLSLTAGVRYTHDKRIFTPDSFFAASGNAPSAPPAGLRIVAQIPFETSANDINPMVNLSYAFTDVLNVYFTFSQGFKGGGFTQRLSSPVPAPLDFKPEVVDLYEIGAKFTGLDGRLRLNLAVFHSDYSDIQVGGVDPRTVGSVTINAGEADINGFEIDTSFLPVEGMLIQAGVGHLDGEYKELGAGVLNIALNDDLPKTPKWTANASVSYEFAFANGMTLTPRLDWSYRDRVANSATASNDPDAFQESYHLLNASLALRTADDKWALILSGKNLTDKLYNYHSGSLDPNFGSADAIFAPPRTWALKLIYNWGD